MRKLLASVLLFGCGVAQAALIDFESLPPGAGTGASRSYDSNENLFFGVIRFTDLLNAKDEKFNVFQPDYHSIGDPGGHTLANGWRLKMDRVDGGTFDLISLKIGESFFNRAFSVQIDGTRSDGTYERVTVTMDGLIGMETVTLNFTGLVSVRIAGLDQLSPGHQLDDFVVSNVPIPAAVWMFASGLGLLGWMRRRN